jgi:hypothetical protein
MAVAGIGQLETLVELWRLLQRGDSLARLNWRKARRESPRSSLLRKLSGDDLRTAAVITATNVAARAAAGL